MQAGTAMKNRAGRLRPGLGDLPVSARPGFRLAGFRFPDFRTGRWPEAPLWAGLHDCGKGPSGPIKPRIAGTYPQIFPVLIARFAAWTGAAGGLLI